MCFLFRKKIIIFSSLDYSYRKLAQNLFALDIENELIYLLFLKHLKDKKNPSCDPFSQITFLKASNLLINFLNFFCLNSFSH